MREITIHEDFEPLLIEYTAGTLSAADRTAVDAHIAGCAPCRKALDEWRQIAEAARADAGDAALPPLDWRRIRDDEPVLARSAMPRAAQKRSFAMSAALFAVIAATAFLAALVLRPTGTGQRQGPYGDAPFGYPYINPMTVPTSEGDVPGIGLPTEVLVGFPTPETVSLVVALEHIYPGQIIQPDQVGLRSFPSDSLPREAFFDLDRVVGKYALSDIAVSIPVLKRHVTDDSRRLAFPVLPEATAELELIEIVVAIQDIPRHKVIGTTDVALQLWNVSSVSESGLEHLYTSLYDVLGKVALDTIRAGMPVLPGKITGDPDDLMPTLRPDRAIVVAARPIPMGAVIAADDIDVREWPAGMKPPGVISDPAEVIGSIALGDFTNGMALTHPMIAAPFVPEFTLEAVQPTKPPTRTPTPGPSPTPLPTIDIVVAEQRINRGQVIQVSDVGYRSWPAPYAPLSAITDMELVVGMFARTDIEREQPILSSHLTDDMNNLAAIGSDAAGGSIPGGQAFTIPRSLVEAVGVQIGQRVDVLAMVLVGNTQPPTFQEWAFARDKLVMFTSDEVVMLAVTPDEAAVLQSLIDARILMRLALAQPVPEE